MENDVGCLLFDVREYFGDGRGFFTEVYCEGRLDAVGFPPIVQMNVSQSVKNTIRGLHFNTKEPQAKMLRVLQGSIIDLVIDLRSGSPKYGTVELYRLSSPQQCLLVPEGYAHGFWAQENGTLLMYGCSRYYAPETDAGISLLDPQFEFPWRGVFDKEKYSTSKKDLEWPSFDFCEEIFSYKSDDRFGCGVMS